MTAYMLGDAEAPSISFSPAGSPPYCTLPGRTEPDFSPVPVRETAAGANPPAPAAVEIA